MSSSYNNCLRDAFLPFLHSGEFSDVEVIQGEQIYKSHKILLSAKSKFFHRLLTSDFKEAKESQVILQFPDPKLVFPIIYEYLYTGRIAISNDKVIGLIAAAEQFIMEELKDASTKHFQETLDVSTAIQYLKDSVEVQSYNTLERCLDVVAQNFYALRDSKELLTIPFHFMYTLLKRHDLQITDEWEFYQFLENYNKHNSLSADKLTALYELVRLPFLSVAQLKEVEKNEKVPMELILEAYRERLILHEKPILFSYRRNQFRASYTENEAVAVNKVKEHDVGWTITNPWKPVVTVSGTGWGDPEAILMDRGGFLTTSSTDSWIQFDLGPKILIQPVSYGFKHGYKSKDYALRNWSLSGSMNGKKWTVLKAHKDDATVCNLNVFYKWKIESKEYFRYFKVNITGENGKGSHEIAVVDFHVFGPCKFLK